SSLSLSMKSRILLMSSCIFSIFSTSRRAKCAIFSTVLLLTRIFEKFSVHDAVHFLFQLFLVTHLQMGCRHGFMHKNTNNSRPGTIFLTFIVKDVPGIEHGNRHHRNPVFDCQTECPTFERQHFRGTVRDGPLWKQHQAHSFFDPFGSLLQRPVSRQLALPVRS